MYGIDSNWDLKRKWFTFNIFAIDNEADWGIVIMYAIDGIFPSVAQNFMHFGRFPSPMISSQAPYMMGNLSQIHSHTQQAMSLMLTKWLTI